MKNILAFLGLVCFASLLSCQDSKDEWRPATPDLSEYKSVGMRIPAETGARWIQAYNERTPQSTRLDGILYSISSAELQSVLNSVDKLVGVAFQYGIDDYGIRHILVVPVDETLRLWTDIEGRKYVDANTGLPITKGKAETWAKNFQAANPNAIWFHYFGRTIFDEILTTSDFVGLDIVPAINDLDLSPQLLLVVGNSTSLLGRTSTETPVYDASYPCPKCEVQ
jgi:hypothetical protein